MAQDVLSFLLDTDDDFVSGEYIAKKLGISRQAVSKRISSLKASGFSIESRTNKGYRLVSFPDSIVPAFIERETYFGPVHHFEEIDSTNMYAKKYALDGAPERTLVVSEIQDAGRGRMGKYWYSPPGGLWFSFVLRPRCEPAVAPILNFVAGNSVAIAVQELYGIEASMKWPNDVYVGDKKLCGIALLMSSDTDMIYYLVIGIGINVNNEAPDDVNAVSLKDVVGRKLDRNVLLAKVLTTFKEQYSMFERNELDEIIGFSRSISNTLGRYVRVSFMGKEHVGKAIDITESGSLVLEFDGKTTEVIAGDVDFIRPI